MYKIAIILLGLFIAPSICLAPNPSFPDENDYIVIQGNSIKTKSAVPFRSQVLGSLIYNIVECESNWKKDAIGKYGEIGLAQFKPKTFNWLSGLSGRKLDINSSEDQLWLLEYALERGLGHHWTCYNKIMKSHRN